MTEVMSQTPPVLHGPSEKERKYDRQLRLWAATGQAALESANILLVNSGSGTVGIETLKNLVLPGIGSFTIVDDAVVQHADLGVNFFLEESSLGKSRAQCCAELLTELNPEVRGDWYPKSQGALNLTELLETSPTYTIILYALPLPADVVPILQAYAAHRQTPLVAVHSTGFYSYFSVRLPGVFPIVDTHPDDTSTADLRLVRPWPELYDFAKSLTTNINALEDHEHGHLPLIVILLHYLDVWRDSHNGAYPLNYKDKTAFRTIVSDGMRTKNPEGGEENFEEAIASVMKYIVEPALPSSLQEVFDFPHVDGGVKSSFWLIAEAVKQFYVMSKVLPLPGAVPDMKAQSSVYIKLQNIYKTKARQDVEEVLALVQNLPGGGDVDRDEVELFCVNARFIKLINYERDGPFDLRKTVEREFANDEVAAIAGPEMPTSLLPHYLALKATSHTPSASASDILSSIRQESPLASENERVAQAAQEVARAAGKELHNISAVTGGMVAQEMIKIVTKQYIPIDNTCIFDGIESRCQVLRL